MLKPKFIIQHNKLRVGRVEMHFELLIPDNKDDVKGGGYWDYDKESNVLYLYGHSIEFGSVSPDDFENIFIQPSLEEATIYLSEEDSLEKAKKNNILIQSFGQ